MRHTHGTRDCQVTRSDRGGVMRTVQQSATAIITRRTNNNRTAKTRRATSNKKKKKIMFIFKKKKTRHHETCVGIAKPSVSFRTRLIFFYFFPPEWCTCAHCFLNDEKKKKHTIRVHSRFIGCLTQFEEL